VLHAEAQRLADNAAEARRRLGTRKAPRRATRQAHAG